MKFEAGVKLSRKAVALAAVLLGAVLAVLAWRRFVAFPPDTTPEGAYLRIAAAIGDARPRECFAYLEDQAQHATYTILDFRQKARKRIEDTYPEPEKSQALKTYEREGKVASAEDEWVALGAERGFITRLRKDLSGIARTEIAGERATIETSRGTRYGFRRRENGIWGLSLFTAELLMEAQRAARDFEIIEKAAQSYERSKKN